MDNMLLEWEWYIKSRGILSGDCRKVCVIIHRSWRESLEMFKRGFTHLPGTYKSSLSRYHVSVINL